MGAEARRLGGATLRVTGLIAVLALVAGALGVGLDLAGAHRPVTDGPSLPWWGIALLFALTESAVLHIQVRREAQTVSISELPLVAALFFAEPAELLVGRVVGSLAVFVLVRRSSALKTTFNTALVTAETCVAVSVFGAVAASGGSAAHPRQWLAAFGAVLAANALGALAIGLVIAVYEGRGSLQALLREAVVGQAFPLAVVVLSLVVVNCLAQGGATAWLVAASAGVLTLCYRVYASLFDRHVNLERLYHFSQAVTDSSDSDAVLQRVLHEAKELMTSDHAELTFASPDPAVPPVRITLGDDGQPRRDARRTLLADQWLEDAVVHGGRSVLLPRRTRDRRSRGWLLAHHLRDAIAVPLKGNDRVIGMLVVGERLGEVRTYDAADVLLLETLANHASVALQKGELIEQLQHDALHDALTKLPNRTHLQRRLAAYLEECASARSMLAVMILDLDGFKDVNDTLGHHQGDVVLKEVAERISRALPDNGFVARLGGDEFAILAPHVASDEAAVRVAERVVTALQEPLRLQGMQFEVGASVGVAMSPEHGRDPSVLLKRADMAMYEAKLSGLKTSMFEPAKDSTSARRLALASAMRTALNEGGIEVHVQPQADAATGRVRSVEALVRWQHESMGWVPPSEFIPVAERSGLIGPLTLRVLDIALRGVSAWRDLDVSVSVNLSPRSLLDPALTRDVAAALAAWEVPPHALVLEVTEGAVMTDPDRAIAQLGRFESMGVRLSIDDFGTGYSSLSYLKRLPVHEVKIDRSFVTGCATSEEDRAIVRSIVTLGTNLGLEIVAEGVEDQATSELLASMGCTRLQGWHISRPMPIDEAGEWLARRAATPTVSAR